MAITEELVCCDMCVLAYQLYHQSVLWPLDPWYEFLARVGSERRNLFMAKVHEWAMNAATVDGLNGASLKGGPAKIRGFGADSNTAIDPIITNYKAINPQLPGWSRDDSQHVVMRAPKYITDTIGQVGLAVYSGDPSRTGTPWATQTQVIPLLNRSRAGTDHLIAFEGGTGFFGPKAGAYSLMGYVLKRVVAGGYNVYICFRGSRSGHALRAVKQGTSHIGNADWISDTDPEYCEDTAVSQYGKVARGFALAIKSCLATIRAACLEIHRLSGGLPPQQIFVTGHSLGAALAAQFCSCCTLGIRWAGYLDRWPWATLKGRFFALPPVGDPTFKARYQEQVDARHIWVHGDMVVEVGQPYFKRGKVTDLAKWLSKLPGDSTQVGEAVRLALPNGAKENPHEMFLIRHALSRNGGGNAQQYVQLQPWATYRTFSDMLAASNNTFYNGKLPIITPAILRELLENYNFAREFRVFLNLFRPLILDPRIYKTVTALQTVNGRHFKLEQFVQAIEMAVPTRVPPPPPPAAAAPAAAPAVVAPGVAPAVVAPAAAPALVAPAAAPLPGAAPPPAIPPPPVPAGPIPPPLPARSPEAIARFQGKIKAVIVKKTVEQVALLMNVQGTNTGKYFGLGILLSNFQNSPVPISIADFAAEPTLKACLDHVKESTT